MTLTITTAPTVLAVSLVEAKAHLIVDFTDDDSIITGFIHAARSACEIFLKAALVPTVFGYKLNGFPPTIKLPVGPVVATSDIAVKYTDTAGAAQTLATTDWHASIGANTLIQPAYGKSWPATRGEMDSVIVSFTAGYASVSDIPASIKQAMFLLIGDYYEDRENGTLGAEMPVTVKNLLMPHVRWGC